MRRNLAALAALALLALAVWPAQAGWWSGEQPGPKTRLAANGEWDTPVVRQPDGSVRLFDVGEGPVEPFCSDFSIPRGDVVQLHPLIAMGDREMKTIVVRRSGQILAEIVFGMAEVRVPVCDLRHPDKKSFTVEKRWAVSRVVGDAHVLAPPSVSVDGADVDEEEWVVRQVRRVVCESWHIAVTGGHPVVVLVNTGLSMQGGSSYEFFARQVGKKALNAAASVSFAMYDEAWLELPPPVLRERFPQGMPFFGGTETKGMSWDFERGMMTGEDGVERPIAPAPEPQPQPQPRLRPQPSAPPPPPAAFYSEPQQVAEDGESCTCQGERKLAHRRARGVGNIVPCDKALTACVFDVRQNPDIDDNTRNPFVFFLWKDGRIVVPASFVLGRGTEIQRWNPNPSGMLQLDYPGALHMDERKGVKPGEKIRFGYALEQGGEPVFVGEATVPAVGKGLWLPYDMK